MSGLRERKKSTTTVHMTVSTRLCINLFLYNLKLIFFYSERQPTWHDAAQTDDSITIVITKNKYLDTTQVSSCLDLLEVFLSNKGIRQCTIQDFRQRDSFKIVTNYYGHLVTGMCRLED